MRAARTDHWPRTAGYFAVFVAIGMETASLGPTLRSLAGHTGSPLGAISYLFTAHSLGYLLGSFFGGRGYDRIPGHRLMVAMLLLMAATLILVPLVPLLWLLAACWLVLGVCGGALDVGGNTLLVWVHGRQMGPFMNALHFFFGLGSLLAPLVVAWSLNWSRDITWAYWVLALLMLPVAFWLLPLPSPSPQAAAAGHPTDDSVPASRSKAGVDDRVIVALISLLLLLYVGAEVAFGGWIYTYALAMDLSDVTTAAYLTSAFWGALTLGRLLSIPLAARYRPRSILLADLLGCLVSVGMFLLWPYSTAATWLGTLGLGLAMASIFPTAISLAERRTPITGQVTGWFLVGASIGAMTLPWLIGQLFERMGSQITMVIILLALVAALGVFAVLLLMDSKDVETTRGEND